MQIPTAKMISVLHMYYLDCFCGLGFRQDYETGNTWLLVHSSLSNQTPHKSKLIRPDTTHNTGREQYWQLVCNCKQMQEGHKAVLLSKTTKIKSTKASHNKCFLDKKNLSKQTQAI